ncbi:MAG: sugar ABC transporter ATP-binding protein [Oscillospiraceae bacterium]|nr:sugar ABC transporter ATP-binding protein [Oscillospiraceae bacterium]
MGNQKVLLRCEGISKRFGGTQALKDVELTVYEGEVLALVGENGAGKSTLMKIVCGLHQQDSGTVEYLGKPYSAKTPMDAIRQGISMIHQELNPEPFLTIAENIFLKRESMQGIFLNKKEQNRKAQELLDNFGFKIPATTQMRDLTLAQMQMVEIIKAASFDAKMIIMDEPTSSLDSEETEHLFQVIRDVKAKGVSVIYISHRMEEIYTICDRVSIFRDGMYIDSANVEGLDKDWLIAQMVGRAVENIYPRTDVEFGDVVFECEGLTGKGFTDITMQIRAGEIVGLSGLVGSGRSETARAIFGMDPLRSGTMKINGKTLKPKNPRHAIDNGICMVNEDRKDYGLCLMRSIRENMSLPNLKYRQKGLLLNQKREKQECTESGKILTLKAASIEANAMSLSGGNQQKVVIAKWIMSNPKLLILDEPTRGVDVGAKAEIYRLMSKFAGEGMAILLISSELPEIMGMSDRVLIYYEGKLNGEFKRADILSGKVTQEDILAKEFGQ